jgi:rRNA maturation endonuclease Nob1
MMEVAPVNLQAEVEFSAVIMPRCPSCHSKHPLAYDPPMPPDTCPECGGAAAQVKELDL